jgi:hypothetical protein
MKVMAPSKKNGKNPPILSMVFINSFEGNCGTFGVEEKKLIVVNDIRSVCLNKIIKIIKIKLE